MSVGRKPTVPYGAWPSPITAARLVEGAAGVGEIRSDCDDIWWNEQRPGEGGRYQLVRWSSGGHRHDLFPAWDPTGSGPNWNARTAVMEYGGGAWGVRDGVVVFANWADQRLYRVDPGSESVPVPITPEPSVPRGYRYSEPTWLDQDEFPGWIVCVRESHEPDAVAANGEAVNELVALPLDGSAVDDPSQIEVLVTGPDFVHSPATHGIQLAWIQWDHPRMPWDGTELVRADIAVGDRGEPAYVFGSDGVGGDVVAGGPAESIVQPGFRSDGSLVFCTDRTGWWNPWVIGGPVEADPPPARDHFEAKPVIADGGIDGEIGGPLWVGGLRWWTELADGHLLVTLRRDGADTLAVIDPDGRLRELETSFSEVDQVVAGPGDLDALVVAGTPTGETAPYSVEVMEPGGDWPTAGLSRLRPHRELPFGTEWFSKPTHISFPSAGGRTAHGLFYPPHNPEVEAHHEERPPLVVMIHGGPTSAARNRLELAKQFWTSRGFAVVDVNYGRPYRDLLQGNWGIVDVEDAVAAARHLADEELVDGHRLAIRGGSAGGYTTLAALCFHDAFKAGASHYGVADLSALAADTHKFESRYLDSMVGPYPEAAATYDARSPVRHTEGFSAPLIVLQGSEDEVVPPSQAEMIVAALAAKGIPHAYLLFEGEQHGFRKAENIVRALEAELWFYGRVFGFVPADPIEPVEGAVGLG